MNLDPDCGYYGTHLWLPKRYIANLTGVRNSLAFMQSNGETVNAWQNSDDHLRVPREYLSQEDLEGLPFTITDIRREPPRLSQRVQLRSTLRDERQEIAYTHMLGGNGVISLACGAGKTIVALHAWAALRTPGLFITHTLDLLEQWRDRILQHTDITEDQIGVLHGQKVNWRKPICLASIQTLAARIAAGTLPDGFVEQWGAVCWDEVHHLAAPTFNTTAAVIDGVRWGLSATHARDDGNDPLYKYHIGPVLYENLDQDLIPQSEFVYTGELPSAYAWEQIRNKTGQVDWNRLCEWLSSKESRNRLIESYIQPCLEQGRKILVLSRRIEHVELLRSRHKGPAGMIHSGVPFKDRKRQLHEQAIIFATADLAREGLDREDLDTVMIVLPVKRKGWIQQTLGRMQRKVAGVEKTPRLYVFEDEKIASGRNACTELRAYLTGVNYPFKITRPPSR